MSLCPTCGQKIKKTKDWYVCPYCRGGGEIGQDRMRCPVCLQQGVILMDPNKLFPKPTYSIKTAYEASITYWKYRYSHCFPSTYPPELWWDLKCKRCREKLQTGHICKDLT